MDMHRLLNLSGTRFITVRDLMSGVARIKSAALAYQKIILAVRIVVRRLNLRSRRK